MTLRRAWLQRWRADQRGATAIEFAIIGPLFILLIVCTIEFGIELLTQLTLDNAAAYAARQVELGNASTASSFVSYVCQQASALISPCSTSTIQVYVTSGSSFGALKPGAISGGKLSPNTYNAGGAGSAVLVQVAYTRPFYTSYLTGIVGATPTLLSTFAVMQQPGS